MTEPPEIEPAGSAGAITPPDQWFWAELDRVQTKWNVLEHPFYAMWSGGGLTAEGLADYAELLDELVGALAVLAHGAAAKASEGILRDLLEDEARAEDRRAGLWRQFVRSMGWDPRSSWHFGSEPSDQLLTCARVWAGDPSRSLALDVVTLCAVGASLSAVASVERAGLLERYGFGDGAATGYFIDRARGRQPSIARLRSALAGLLPDADCLALLSQTEAACVNHWQVLDELCDACR